jgi:DNA-binding beta-propeller fold protein YncE
MTPRGLGLLCISALAPVLLTGCGSRSAPELVWGKRGVLDGELVKPRAIAIGPGDRLYIVDWTARIQAFDRNGTFLDTTWLTPDIRLGRPSGLSVDPKGDVIVSDSHYRCVRVYSPEGILRKTIGLRYQLGYVSDALRDEAGNFYVSEWGDENRISKYDSDGELLKSWGAAGPDPGQFARIRAMAFGPDGKSIFVADSCNHRIQVFSTDGELLRCFGVAGTGPGELKYPYDVACSRTHLYVVERENCRVQKFTLTGESVGTWGGPGRLPGQLNHPWALAVDSVGRVHVVDSENDRIQRIAF